ncbi:DUF4381 domain-containing protein [Aliiglaciecola litoralis]|uniref:DUF4381 domain-containing protein n=1 Tax=Aliiglaciecola litoralis TaxID=582857 RepID=A0ABP3WNE0_9ALTE
MNPLEQLNDIHVPDSVSVWPLAWGWWLLMGVSILVVCVVTVWLYRYLSARRVKRMALQELRTLNPDNPTVYSEVNQLLKRVALAYFPSAPIASLYGEQWCNFLTQQLPDNKQQDFKQACIQLQQNLYQKTPESSAESVIDSAKTWIQHSLPPTQKQLERAQVSEVSHV